MSFFGKPVSTFPGHALAAFPLISNDAAQQKRSRHPALLLRQRRRVARIERIDAGAPHLDEGGRGQLLDRLPGALDRRERVAPNGALAPALTLLFAFVGGAHRLPGHALRMLDMFGSALPALLEDQIK